MSALDRLEKQKTSLQQQWDEIQQKIAALGSDRVHETRAEEKLRLDAQIRAADAEREVIEAKLELVEGEIDVLGKVADARELERKQAYGEAIEVWQEILGLSPQHPDATRQIERLSRRAAEQQTRKDLMARLSRRYADSAYRGDLKDVYSEVNKRLRESANGDDLQILVGQLLDGALDAEAFKAQLRDLVSSGAGAGPAEVDLAVLSRSLRHGDVALFLGSAVPSLLDPNLPGDAAVAAGLAQPVGLSPAERTVPEIAEYYLITPYGARALVRRRSELLPQPAAVNPLHGLLAGIEQPLLIISAAQDSLLEAAFSAAGKRYVVVRSIVSPAPGLLPGQLLLQYSDKAEAEDPKSEAELSTLAPLKAGYSVIFKIRGNCPPNGDPDARDLSSLVLSESSLIAFAGRREKIIPDYLGKALHTRGLWFLGFEPRRWEDRLIASAVLASRAAAPEPARVVAGRMDPFEEAYWASNRVRPHLLDLSAFVGQLGGGPAAQPAQPAPGAP